MLVYLTSFTVFLEILKKKRTEMKKKLWKWPVNWSFLSFIYLFFFRPPTLMIIWNFFPVNQLIKKFWPKEESISA